MRQGRGATRRVRAASLAALTTALTTALMGAGMSGATAAGAARAPRLEDRLLARSDLPAGWHLVHSGATTLDGARSPCLRGLVPTSAARPSAAGEKRATASFAERSGLPAVSESLAAGVTAAALGTAVSALGRCHHLTLAIDAAHVGATLRAMSLPLADTAAHAFALSLVVGHVPIGADIVLFRAGGIGGELTVLGVGAPTPVTAAHIVNTALSKAEGHAVAPIRAASVVAAPVKVAHTSMGRIGYREVGSGPPLVMIMGFGGTMETWDPRFVDALAHDHEVVIFDNAGIGETRALRAPLTVDAMANQTAALIRALGLRRPDMLGWSMGSMVAEALAVLHPARVGRLVLCAAYPGTGSVRPTQKAITALRRGTPTALFPPGQRTAGAGYRVSLSGWPTSTPAPAGVVAAQARAITDWWSGKDAAGARLGAVSAPTLVMDGTLDRLDPQANARTLHRLIAGSQLVRFPDAGHAFLFQDGPAVVARIESFLSA